MKSVRSQRFKRSKGESSMEVEAAKRKTFDRKTFTECSTRMMTTVPTLNRQQQSHNVETAFDTDNSDSSRTASSQFKLPKQHLKQKVNENNGIWRKFTQKPDVRIIDDQSGVSNAVDVDVMEMVNVISQSENYDNLPAISSTSRVSTLPNTRCTVFETTSSNRNSIVRHATLPSNSGVNSRKVSLFKHGSSILKKPFTQLATLMSSIGSNVDIVSYHAP